MILLDQEYQVASGDIVGDEYNLKKLSLEIEC